MMKKIALITFILTFTFASMSFSQGFEKVGRVGAKFLQIGVGARPAAMGEAFTAMSNDALSVFWNPAGLTYIEGQDFAGSYIKWPADIYIHSAAYAVNMKGLGSFAVSAVVLSMGDMRVRTAYYPEGTGEMFTASDFALGLSYARKLTDKFSVGGTVKYVLEKYYNESTSGIAVDIGTVYETGFKSLKLAMSVQNFGPDLQMSGNYLKWSDFETPGAVTEFEPYSLPLTFRFGLAINIADFFLESGSPHAIVTAIDAMHPADNAESANFGMEYVFNNMVALRGGYKYNVDEGGFAAGAGFKYSVGGITTKLDYSYTDFGRLNAVHRASIGFGF